jgi:hypothetical protein
MCLVATVPELKYDLIEAINNLLYTTTTAKLRKPTDHFSSSGQNAAITLDSRSIPEKSRAHFFGSRGQLRISERFEAELSMQNIELDILSTAWCGDGAPSTPQ